VELSWGFLSSLTLSAYLKVLRVCSQAALLGEIFPIITVLQFPVKESLRTRVNLLPLKGVCFLSWSSALIHSLRARRDLLISAPSILVCLLESVTSAPLSDPAKSMKDIFPYNLFPSFSEICKIAWEREESMLAEVEASMLEIGRKNITCSTD